MAADVGPDVIETDLLNTMTQKLARRMWKIRDVVDNNINAPLAQVVNTISRTAEIMQGRWKETMNACINRIHWTTPSPEQIEESMHFTFTNSQTYLVELVGRTAALKKTSPTFDVEATNRQLISSCSVRLDPISTTLPENINRLELEIGLYDLECWVKAQLPSWVGSSARSSADCAPLASILHLYMEHATNAYRNAPERTSVMWLTALELWIALDRLVISWCPLLGEFSPDIPHELFEPLLLPFSEQLKRLQQAESYLQKRHNASALKGRLSAIYGDINSPSSFHNRYFLSSSELKRLKRSIEEKQKQARQQKEEELWRLNKKHRDLLNEIGRLSCQYYKEYYYGDYIDRHASWCYKCSLVKESNSIHIQKFEDYLPDEDYRSQPLVFELDCPLPFGIWRDATHQFRRRAMKHEASSATSSNKLSDYEPTDQYFVSKGFQISVASSSIPISRLPGRDCRIPSEVNSVIFPHAGQYCIFDTAKVTFLKEEIATEAIRSHTTFQIDPPYAPTMQHFVLNTNHTPNSVIASQSRCPVDLPLSEYVAFGHLRSGNALQWRNIARALCSHSLSFIDPSIYLLLAQATWQVGPGISEDYCRDAHRDLQDVSFSQQLLDTVQWHMDRLRDSGTKVWHLACLILIASRSLSLSPDNRIANSALRLLSQARTIALSWIQKLECANRKEAEPSKDYQQRISVLAMVCRSTFDVEARYLPSICQENSIHIMIDMLVLIASNPFSPETHAIQTLARRDQLLSYRLEPFISNTPGLSILLDDIARKSWPSHIKSKSWSCLSSQGGRWWKSNPSSPLLQTIHINVIEGTLLVNGKTANKLPQEYLSHSSYKAVFRKNFSLKARPSDMVGMDYEAPYREFMVHFKKAGGDLVIRIQHQGAMHEYIPGAKLQEDIPASFIANYDLWYKEMGTTRVITFGACKDFLLGGGSPWQISLESHPRFVTGYFHKLQAGHMIVAMNPHSQTFIAVHKILHVLEPEPLRMDVFIAPDGENRSIRVDLPRHYLHFYITDAGTLECANFPGYQVADSQDMGCLYGLTDYLVLSDNSTAESQRKVLIPKGNISILSSRNGHPHVHIKCLDQGGFYALSIDDLVGRLHGFSTVESDLHLIELHACTSSAFSDPLTGRRGIDEALDRLQSASLFSYQALPRTWRAQIKRISNISAPREFHPPHLSQMEKVTWNRGLPPSSQSPVFHFAVNRLLEHWENITRFDTNGPDCKPIESGPGMSRLSTRALLRGTAAHGCRTSHDTTYTRTFNMASKSSQDRELISYSMTLSTMGIKRLPMHKDLEADIQTWPVIKASQGWSFKDVASWFSRDINNTWTTFYSLCRTGSPTPSLAASLAFSITAYYDPTLQPILEILGRIQLENAFRQPGFAHEVHTDLLMNQGCIFKEDQVRNHLQQTAIGFDNSPEALLIKSAKGETHKARVEARRSEYRSAVASEIHVVIEAIRLSWPNYPSNGVIPVTPQRHLAGVKTHVKDHIFPLLVTWTRNLFFIKHIRKVLQQLALTPEAATTSLLPFHQWIIRPPRIPSPLASFIDLNHLLSNREITVDISSCDGGLPFGSGGGFGTTPNRTKPTSLEALLNKLQGESKSALENHYISNLKSSIAALRDSPSFPRARIVPIDLLRQTTSYQLHVLQHLKQSITDNLSPHSRSEELISRSGLWPLITSKILLRKLSFTERFHTPADWIFIISHLANQIINVQHVRRILRSAVMRKDDEYGQEVLLGRKNRMKDDLEWLLLEIDGDFCIRSRQVKVANAMIDPPEQHNSVMQLDMGEGKSSVIVPMAAGKLADSSRLVRVVVLKPQANLQLQLLRQRLSGLANRRIFSLPLSRDLKVNNGGAETMKHLLECWLKTGGVWLCQPEHILSFQLLGLDTLMRGKTNPNMAHKLIECQIWTKNNTRDILDESDEILHPRNQLIYTIGSQSELDAAPSRWEIVQQLLSQLHHKLSRSSTTNGFLVTYAAPPANQSFPVIRIVGDSAHAFLVDLAQEIVFKSTLINVRLRNLSTRLKDAALQFITVLAVKPLDAADLESYCRNQGKDDPVLWKSLLLLRGLIAYRILFTVLKEKRWKVEYGLDLRRSQLAVPYRALNSPSIRSDFAHPDVLIITTCLSYYYGGMEDDMISRTMEQLFKTDNPELIYGEWLSECSTIPEAVKDLRSLALEDEGTMILRLRPIIKHNKRAIDFFLNNCVFSKEAKSFPQKMSTSGWDLAATKVHPTTGFSGTNDSRFLLPTTIVQVDSAEQRHTNATVLERILRPENSTIVVHRDKISSDDLLASVMEQKTMPKVFLDVGAQILDRRNKEFVAKWLSLLADIATIKAGVYFDEDDNLRVISRDGSTQAFSESPFVNLLNECVVFLDDAHTRGTDLKLPPCRAAVTLGPRLTKDKLAQGCMRMRKLGSSHSLVFFAPEEVAASVKRVSRREGDITVPEVVMWTMKETCRQLDNNAPLWAIQGHEFAKRKIGWDSLEGQKATADQVEEAFSQPDSRTLNQHYGIDQKQGPNAWISEYHRVDAVNPISQQIFEQSKLFGGFAFHEARAQEEQEVELVQEEEVERQVERPPDMMPRQHSIHPD
ncbi:hypothetical protein FRC14_007412, partial [Serendipita sp. 396]